MNVGVALAYILAKQPYILAKEPYILAKEPYILAKEPYVPYAATRALQVALAWARVAHVMQHCVAVCCSVLQYVVVCCSTHSRVQE